MQAAHKGTVLLLALAVWLVAWAVTVPFGGFPDELDHYVRAISVGDGEIVGRTEPGVERLRDVAKTCCADGNATALAWVRRGNRYVSLPDRLRPETMRCADVVANERIGCGSVEPGPAEGHVTTMGTIEPAAYGVAGVVAVRAGDPWTAARLLRLTNVLVALALLGVGIRVLLRSAPGPMTTAGLALALTPMALFVMASPSPNSWEVAGAFAFACGALALAGEGPVDGRLPWVGAGLGGIALAASRSLGPLWVLAAMSMAAAVGDWRLVVERIRRRPGWATAVAAAVLTTALSTVVWEQRVQPHVEFDAGFFRRQVGSTVVQDSGRVLREIVGAFGSLDLSMPLSVYLIWWAGLAALVATAVARGRAPERGALLAGLAGVYGTFVLVSAAVLRQNGFRIQGRHVLPAVLIVAVAAAHVVGRRVEATPRLRTGAAALVTLTGLANAVALASGTLVYRAGADGLRSAPFSLTGGSGSRGVVVVCMVAGSFLSGAAGWAVARRPAG